MPARCGDRAMARMLSGVGSVNCSASTRRFRRCGDSASVALGGHGLDRTAREGDRKCKQPRRGPGLRLMTLAGQSAETASPPARVVSAPSVQSGVDSVNVLTEPSAIPKFAVPEWKL